MRVLGLELLKLGHMMIKVRPLELLRLGHIEVKNRLGLGLGRINMDLTKGLHEVNKGLTQS